MPKWRPFPTDTPARDTTWRRGTVRSVHAAAGTGYHIEVDFPPQGTEMAFALLAPAVGDIVHCRWRNESGLWWIS